MEIKVPIEANILLGDNAFVKKLCTAIPYEAVRMTPMDVTIASVRHLI